jgi:hypothetical protein
MMNTAIAVGLAAMGMPGAVNSPQAAMLAHQFLTDAPKKGRAGLRRPGGTHGSTRRRAFNRAKCA